MKRFLPFFEEVFSYSFTDEPYYSKLRHHLTKILLEGDKLPTESIKLCSDNTIIQRAYDPKDTRNSLFDNKDELCHEVADETDLDDLSVEHKLRKQQKPRARQHI